VSVASAANDHRLGANEAPPAIVSIFLGEELTGILESIECGSVYDPQAKVEMKIGVHVLPSFPKDTTDRNRTSPFAFTGNKFEFRMLGSSFSIAGPNFVLNTIIAEELSQFADQLENAKDFTKNLNALIKTTITEHKRIIFNGNNYSAEWVKEAEKRGLLNLKTTVDALPYFISDKNIKLFTKHKIFTEPEMYSRYEIQMENYCKIINIEALTMVEMVKKEIIPAVCSYIKELSDTAISKKALSTDLNCELEKSIVAKLSSLCESLYKKTKKLEENLLGVKNQDTLQAQGKYYRDIIFLAMQELRAVADEIEALVGEEYWPYPTYGQLLFSV
jgi:glutamine synthetase